MKKIYSSLMATCLLATSFLTVGCIDETEPNSMATSEQLAANATATEALLWAMPAYMSTFDVLGYDDDAFHYDYGMGSMMQIRDVMGEEYVATAHTYEWYDSWVNNYYLGRDYVSQALVWQTFYKSILTTNQLIKAVNPETASSVQLSYLAAGKAFRAALYLDLARMYEFLPNDGTDRINADGQDVFGLTVPFVFENTTEAEARNNPRAFHTDAFNYIKKDLEEALELYDENGTLKDKQLPGFAATQGLLARAYMWHGSFLKEFGAEYDELCDAVLAHEAQFDQIAIAEPLLGEVGNDASVELLPTPEQRTGMYRKIREYRATKPLFAMDFQNDAEYVGGCIAGGKRYLHINANGDVDPCVFVHYSDSNIRQKTLLEALQSPMFMQYHDNMPFNDNMLMPCPMLENSGRLTEMVNAAGAHSTDLQSPESAEHLCGKTKTYADTWAPVADRLWQESQGRKAE